MERALGGDDQGGLKSPSLEVSEGQLDIGHDGSNVGLDDLGGLFQPRFQVWDPPWRPKAW